MKLNVRSGVWALALTIGIGVGVSQAVATPLFQQEQRSEPDYSKNKTYQQGQREGQADRAKKRTTARSGTSRKTMIRKHTKPAIKRAATTNLKA